MPEKNGMKGIEEMPAVLENHLRHISIKWLNTKGKIRRWEAVRRLMENKETNKNSFDDIVVVVPITDEGEIIFISQFRATVGKIFAKNEEVIDESKYQVIEFPAGIVDAGRTKAETAIMELSQEAGYSARKLKIINEGPVSAGLSFEYVTEYIATDLYPVPKSGGDEESEITVYRIPLNSAIEWLKERKEKGCVIDSRVIPLISLVR